MGKIRPIMVKGHERALTMIKYNRDGDLLFSCSKDHVPSLWYSENGERIGTYHGHCGTVWCLDVNCTPRCRPCVECQRAQTRLAHRRESDTHDAHTRHTHTAHTHAPVLSVPWLPPPSAPQGTAHCYSLALRTTAASCGTCARASACTRGCTPPPSATCASLQATSNS